MVMTPDTQSTLYGTLGYNQPSGPGASPQPNYAQQPNTSMGGGTQQYKPLTNPQPGTPQGLNPSLPNAGMGQYGQQPPPNINLQPANPGGNSPTPNVRTGTQPNIGVQQQTQPAQPAQPAAPQGPNLQDQLQQFLSGQVMGGARGPAGVPQFNPGQNPFLDQGTFQNQTNLVNNMLTNPSPYSSSLVQNQFNTFDQALQQQIAAAKTGVNEDAASRGIFYGSTPEGQLGDINIQGNIARANMMNQLLQSQAQTLGGYEQAALGAAGGYAGQQAGAQQQAYNQQNQNLQNLLGYGQQQFNNQLAGAQFNQSQDALQQQLQLALMGA